MTLQAPSTCTQLNVLMFSKLNAEFMTKMTAPHLAFTKASASTDTILPGTVVAASWFACIINNSNQGPLWLCSKTRPFEKCLLYTYIPLNSFRCHVYEANNPGSLFNQNWKKQQKMYQIHIWFCIIHWKVTCNPYISRIWTKISDITHMNGVFDWLAAPAVMLIDKKLNHDSRTQWPSQWLHDRSGFEPDIPHEN